MGQRSVELTGGPPWGFRLTTGTKVSRVHPGCCAAQLVREGDRIERINGELVTGLSSHQAQVSSIGLSAVIHIAVDDQPT